MSHPHEVPPSWRKGEKLRVVGAGPRYALMQDMTAAESFQRFVVDGEATPESIAGIEFDCSKDVNAFVEWWNSDNGRESQ